LQYIILINTSASKMNKEFHLCIFSCITFLVAFHYMFAFQEEITAVEIMRESSDHAESSFGALLDNQKSKKNCEDVRKGWGSAGRGATSFQIRTLTDGFNSGRTYYLHSNTADECKEVFEVLRKFAEIARKRAEKYSKFRESQKWLRAVYDSNMFQLGSSLLIVMVTPTP
jgi:hypothetical protein